VIVEMRKLDLIAMSYDRDAVLNALHRTNAVEIKMRAEEVGTVPVQADAESLREELNSLNAALETLVKETQHYAAAHKLRSELLKDGFEISYEEFMNAPSDKARVTELLEKINALYNEGNAWNVKFEKTARMIKEAHLYGKLSRSFDDFCDTAHTHTRLGTVDTRAWEKVALPELAAAETIATDSEHTLVAVSFHNSAAAECERILSGVGFSVCPYSGTETGAELLARLSEEKQTQETERERCAEELYKLSDGVRMLKIYSDYLAFELEKAEQSAKLRATDRTFLLEAFVPKGAEETVRKELSAVKVVYFTFSDLKEDEDCPTLYHNNAVVSNFETITNMYSVPNARELDPSTVMAFFYSLFLGFIMADIGYGLVMVLVGGILWYKKRKQTSGLKSMAGVFAVGGVFAIVWGVLFNSFFGFTLPMYTVMPNAQKDMWTFAGIRIPSVLIVAMLIGVAQLLAGYVCLAVQNFRRGKIADGILDGLVWAVFSFGAGMALVGLVEEFSLSVLAAVGGVMAAAALVIAALTAGRKEKFLGKFTKGFGALYGIVNYASDVLSYARLYGLMLSGAVIAQVVASYATSFFEAGGFMIVVAVLLLVIGHGFNLAMGLLSAYIHDARLQYVEFYGRFFEGGGRLFTPLGSVHRHVTIAAKSAEKTRGNEAKEKAYAA